jgi:hypothetical protein
LSILASHPLDTEHAATMRAGLGKCNVDDPADLVRVGNRGEFAQGAARLGQGGAAGVGDGVAADAPAGFQVVVASQQPGSLQPVQRGYSVPGLIR